MNTQKWIFWCGVVLFAVSFFMPAVYLADIGFSAAKPATMYGWEIAKLLLISKEHAGSILLIFSANPLFIIMSALEITNRGQLARIWIGFLLLIVICPGLFFGAALIFSHDYKLMRFLSGFYMWNAGIVLVAMVEIYESFKPKGA